MHERTLISIRNSALWAAYGDALGFISELVDRKGLEKRIKALRITRTIPWRRRVGGRFGVEIMLPAGCYSDDTQLRLSTSRAIRGDGEFDVEVFAKVELPVWLSYALGAGRGSRAAATSLGHQNVNWFSNFFNSEYSNYIDCGGNGAAMRIQPHIWSAKILSEPDTFILDVVKNALCTHGHPRGILGAVFHALCLAMTLEAGEVAGPDEWAEAIAFFPKVAALIRCDENLSLFWLPTWEDRAGESIESAFDRVRDECFSDIIEVNNCIKSGRPDTSYAQLVEALGAMKEDQRGSGTKTAIIASALSWLYKNDYPVMALQASANLLHSDTDTIGTMAGAILGCVVNEAPDADLQDSTYIEAEATRLYKITKAEPVMSFPYPDLGMWQPPTTLLDVVGIVGEQFAVAGLGPIATKGDEYKSQNKDAAIWQWSELEFGESILIKRRENPRQLSPHNLPLKPMQPTSRVQTTSEPKVRQQISFSDTNPRVFKGREGIRANEKTVHELTNDAIESDFNEELIGRHLLSLAMHPDGIEKVIAYASIIAKARISRLNSRNYKR
jgi:ADP-ribosylglycohydrolase